MKNKNIQFKLYAQPLYKRDKNSNYVRDSNGKMIKVGEKLSFYWWEGSKRKTHMLPVWVKTKAQIKEYMENFQVPDSEEPKNADVMYFSDYASKVIAGMQKGYAKETRLIYKRAVRVFIQLVGDKPIKMYNYDDIVEFKNKRKEMTNSCIKNKNKPKKFLSPVTINIEVRDLHHIFEESVKSNYRTNNPCKGIIPEIEPQKARRNFAKRDIPILLNALKRPHARKIAIIAFNTGMRLNEILHIQFTDFVFKDEYTWRSIYQRYKHLSADDFKEFAMSVLDHVKIENKPGFTLKDHDNRNVILTWEVFDVAFVEFIKIAESNIMNLESWIFSNPKTGRPYNSCSTSHYLNDVIRELGFPAGKYVFHSSRHTAITNMLHAGIPLDTVQELAGHASPNTTAGYAHPDFEAEREKFNSIKYSSL